MRLEASNKRALMQNLSTAQHHHYDRMPGAVKLRWQLFKWVICHSEWMSLRPSKHYSNHRSLLEVLAKSYVFNFWIVGCLGIWHVKWQVKYILLWLPWKLFGRHTTAIFHQLYCIKCIIGGSVLLLRKVPQCDFHWELCTESCFSNSRSTGSWGAPQTLTSALSWASFCPLGLLDICFPNGTVTGWHHKTG